MKLTTRIKGITLEQWHILVTYLGIMFMVFSDIFSPETDAAVGLLRVVTVLYSLFLMFIANETFRKYAVCKY